MCHEHKPFTLQPGEETHQSTIFRNLHFVDLKFHYLSFFLFFKCKDKLAENINRIFKNNSLTS